MRVNPTAGLGFIVRAPIRERRLDDKELAKLWHGIWARPVCQNRFGSYCSSAHSRPSAEQRSLARAAVN